MAHGAGSAGFANPVDIRARQQKEGLAAILAQAGQSARQTLDQIMGLFTPVTEIFLTFGEGFAKLQQKLSALLEGRPGAREVEAARDPQGQGFEGPSLGTVNLAPGPVWTDPELKELFLNDLRALAEPPPDPAPAKGRKRLRWLCRGGALDSIVLEDGTKETGARSQNKKKRARGKETK